MIKTILYVSIYVLLLTIGYGCAGDAPDIDPPGTVADELAGDREPSAVKLPETVHELADEQKALDWGTDTLLDGVRPNADALADRKDSRCKPSPNCILGQLQAGKNEQQALAACCEPDSNHDEGSTDHPDDDPIDDNPIDDEESSF